MKTLIYSLLITMSLACGDAGIQPLDPGQPMVDGSPGQSQADAVPDVAVADAMTLTSDAAPAPIIEVQCRRTGGYVLMYDAMGRPTQRRWMRGAPVPSTDTTFAFACYGSNHPWFGYPCAEDMVSCFEPSGDYLSCMSTTFMLMTSGTREAYCGYEMEMDTDLDGAWEPFILWGADYVVF